MTGVSARDVKELREMTNISMMKCKEALMDAGGDREGALRILRERGLAVAEKRADRNTNEGLVYSESNGGKGWMMVVSCETDFVARSDDFTGLVKKLAAGCREQGEPYLSSEVARDLIGAAAAKCGEKIEVKEAIFMEATADEMVGSYLHSNGKVGALVKMGCPEPFREDAEMKDLARDLAMQVAAMHPLAVADSDIDVAIREEQRQVFKKQMENSGKPEDIVERIVEGKLKKHFSDLCLLDMDFIKETKLKVKDLIDRVGKTLDASIQVKMFNRLQVGK